MGPRNSICYSTAIYFTARQVFRKPAYSLISIRKFARFARDRMETPVSIPYPLDDGTCFRPYFATHSSESQNMAQILQYFCSIGKNIVVFKHLEECPELVTDRSRKATGASPCGFESHLLRNDSQG